MIKKIQGKDSIIAKLSQEKEILCPLCKKRKKNNNFYFTYHSGSEKINKRYITLGCKECFPISKMKISPLNEFYVFSADYNFLYQQQQNLILEKQSNHKKEELLTYKQIEKEFKVKIRKWKDIYLDRGIVKSIIIQPYRRKQNSAYSGNFACRVAKQDIKKGFELNKEGFFGYIDKKPKNVSFLAYNYACKQLENDKTIFWNPITEIFCFWVKTPQEIFAGKKYFLNQITEKAKTFKLIKFNNPTNYEKLFYKEINYLLTRQVNSFFLGFSSEHLVKHLKMINRNIDLCSFNFYNSFSFETPLEHFNLSKESQRRKAFHPSNFKSKKIQSLVNAEESLLLLGYKIKTKTLQQSLKTYQKNNILTKIENNNLFYSKEILQLRKQLEEGYFQKFIGNKITEKELIKILKEKDENTYCNDNGDFFFYCLNSQKKCRSCLQKKDKSLFRKYWLKKDQRHELFSKCYECEKEEKRKAYQGKTIK
jgi:hypothetical protein